MVNIQKMLVKAQSKATALAEQHGVQIPGLNYGQPQQQQYQQQNPGYNAQGSQNYPGNHASSGQYQQQGHYQQYQQPTASQSNMSQSGFKEQPSSQNCDSDDRTIYWNPTFYPNTPVSMFFKFEIGDHGWGNAELQNYVTSAENAFHSAGNALVIRATKQGNSMRSARLISHATLGKDRGTLRAIVSPPCAKGIWPALWLLPQQPSKWPEEGEIDIVETSNGDQNNHSCLHWGHYNTQDQDKHATMGTKIDTMASGTPLLYEFVWDQPNAVENGRMVWYINGKAIMRASAPKGTRRLKDWSIIINVAMGGNLCQGQIPDDGKFEFVIHNLCLADVPSNGWDGFEQDCRDAPQGKPLRL